MNEDENRLKKGGDAEDKEIDDSGPIQKLGRQPRIVLIITHGLCSHLSTLRRDKSSKQPA
jgi:hypothetical protein